MNPGMLSGHSIGRHQQAAWPIGNPSPRSTTTRDGDRAGHPPGADGWLRETVGPERMGMVRLLHQDGPSLEAGTINPQCGKLAWRGLIGDDQLNTMATVVQYGKPPLENRILAATDR